MAKKRVHELAAELGIQAKELLKQLNEKGYEVKSVLSSVDDDVVNKFKAEKQPAKKPAQTAQKPQKEQTKSKENQPARAPKKDASASNGGREGRKPGGDKSGFITVRFDDKNGDKNRHGSSDRNRTSSGDRNRNTGDRPRFSGERGGSDRPRFNGDRNNSDRSKFNGDRSGADRNAGDRPRYNGDRNASDRPRYNGDRSGTDRNTGDRPRFNGDRNTSDRPRYNNDRNGSDRPRCNGDRSGERGSSDRPRFNGDRGGLDRPRYNGDKSGAGRGYNDRNGDNRNQRNGRNAGNMGMGFNKDADDEQNVQRRRASSRNDRKDFDAGAMSAKDLKSQNRDNYNRDKNKPRKGNRRSPEEVEADISRLAKPSKHKKHQPVEKVSDAKTEETIKTITLPEMVTIKELADAVKTPVNSLIKKLFLEGKMYNVNSELPYEEAAEIALEYNCIAEEEEKVDVIEELLKEDEESEADMVSRPPVVCVMGHVDHGKTSLLDAIRQTNVTAKEAGGITQHIGASVVEVNDQTITFLDTPGHEAFTAMRMRGAQSTDIAILVVAADDGVMPQTIEAINHARAAGIEIIVAINKIDKESANIERVKQELTEYEILSEEWGGNTLFCPVSAHTREGIDNLLDSILLTAEMLELKANPNRKARGIVIEAFLDKGRGPVATVLVQKGTLKVGDYIAVGSAHGKVRAMINDKHEKVDEATPSTPVQVLGLDSVPAAGEIFMTVENEKEARQISETYISQDRIKLLAETKSRMSLDDLYSQIQAGNVKELNLIIKADVQGSVEAVKTSLLKLSNEEVAVKCIHSGVGAINESDIILASASNAIVIGFNTRPDVRAKDLADAEKVDVRLYRVIYNAIEDIESAMKGMLDPIYEEQIIGHAEIRQTYKASGVGTIAGSYVLDGNITRNSSVRITREGNLIFEGKIASLKRFKDDVKEVKSGFECGIVFENFNDVSEEDQIEAYIMVEVPR